MTSRAEIVAFARGWKDVPFVHQGRSRTGIDCGGLIIKTAQAFGRSNFDTIAYRRIPAGIGGEKIEDVCRRELRQIDPGTIQIADVALFLFGKRPRHLAIVGDYYAGGLSLIHAYEPVKRVTEVRFDDSWRALLFEAYSLLGAP